MKSRHCTILIICTKPEYKTVTLTLYIFYKKKCHYLTASKIETNKKYSDIHKVHIQIQIH